MLTTKNIVLTKETIALAKERCRGRIDLIKNLGHEAFPDFTADGLLDVIAICDSHEALRSRVEELTARLEAAEQEKRQVTLPFGPSAVLQVWTRWKAGLTSSQGWTHADGERFVRMVNEMFAPYAAGTER